MNVSTANLLKEELITALAHYKSKVAEYKAATIVLKNSQDEGKYSPAQDVTDEIKEVDKLKSIEINSMNNHFPLASYATQTV